MQHEKNTITKIHFEETETRCITPCPGPKLFTFVGSSNCGNCDYFISIDEDKNIVECCYNYDKEVEWTLT